MPEAEFDLAVVGGGILGLATARELLRRHPGRSIAVLEREDRPGAGQTGANSGVIHAGIYYAPGSLKARLCVEGARALHQYCADRGVQHERIGKLVVATSEAELPALAELERRGMANGVPGLERIERGRIAELEPNVSGVAALWSPHTGIVDFQAVADALAEDVRGAGGTVLTGFGVEEVRARGSHLGLGSPNRTVRARAAVFCAGLAAGRLARLAGGSADPRVLPFRGRYLKLRPERSDLVRHNVYPVPDPRLPFLGPHLTPTLAGDVLLGPSALLAEPLRSASWPGTWRMARRWWRTGARELRLAASRRALVSELRRMVPSLRPVDCEPAFSGVRAQAVARDGTLLDDFAFSRTERALHVRNAPSPGATSALAIAALIADRAERELGV